MGGLRGVPRGVVRGAAPVGVSVAEESGGWGGASRSLWVGEVPRSGVPVLVFVVHERGDGPRGRGEG